MLCARVCIAYKPACYCVLMILLLMLMFMLMVGILCLRQWSNSWFHSSGRHFSAANICGLVSSQIFVAASCFMHTFGPCELMLRIIMLCNRCSFHFEQFSLNPSSVPGWDVVVSTQPFVAAAYFMHTYV